MDSYPDVSAKEQTFYLQGYKIDRKKMREILSREEDEPDGVFEALWYQPIINSIPETA